MKLSKTAVWMFALLAIAITVGVVGEVLQAAGVRLNGSYTNTIVSLSLVGLLALHSKWQVGGARAVVFFLLAALIGFGSEVWGLRSGTVFGAYYIYNSSSVAQIWGVPYLIPVYWAIFIYTAYSMTNGFWLWLGYQKPSKSGSRLYSLIPAIVFDGLLTVALDLVMDPIKVHEGAWTWLDNGAYFGIPVGNFVGWFAVTITVTGLFRLYEYLRPAKPVSDTYLLLIPVAGYGLLGVGFGISAAVYGMPYIAALSAALMVMPAAINLLLYVNRVHRAGPVRMRPL